MPSPVISDFRPSSLRGSLSSFLMSRAASIGVSVNETSSDTATANDAVKPNEDMNLPTMPCMNPMGTKSAIRLSVVAMTAGPISRLPSIAA